MSIDVRLEAANFAKGITKQLDVAKADVPYLEAVLIEAALFEDPMSELVIGINKVGAFYNITIKGYQSMIDLVRWVNTFCGMNRAPQLCHVTHTYTQLTDTLPVMVIQMNKIEFHTATASAAAAASENGGRKFKKRTE